VDCNHVFAAPDTTAAVEPRTSNTVRLSMPIPTFDKMFRPLLEMATAQPLTRRIATSAMAQHFKLTPDECSDRIPSGNSTFVENRAGWAMTFLTKAELIEKVAPKTYQATPKGIAFLAKHPTAISVADLHALPGWREAWHRQKSDGDEGVTETATATPVESLDTAIKTINADLKTRLLEAILAQSPAFFERLVLDVLVKIGYGGSRANAAEHLGKSGDEGVDGRINQDPLGLDQILVQAKRYKPDSPIDRKTIQAFVGSMTGQGVTKGVFITTSTFNDNAREFVLRGAHTKVVLLDGSELLDLMLQHHIGVHMERQVEVLDLDQNYFSDEE
jgi:restriction system protein